MKYQGIRRPYRQNLKSFIHFSFPENFKSLEWRGKSFSSKSPTFWVMPDTSWLGYFPAQEDSDIDGWLLPIPIVWIETYSISGYFILKSLKRLSDLQNTVMNYFFWRGENWIQIDSPYLKWNSWECFKTKAARGTWGDQKVAIYFLSWLLGINKQKCFLIMILESQHIFCSNKFKISSSSKLNI